MMDKNEKFLNGWLAYFYSRISKFKDDNMSITNIPDRILNKEEKKKFLQQVQIKVEKYAKCSKKESRSIYNHLDYDINNYFGELETALSNTRCILHSNPEVFEEILAILKKTVGKYERNIKIKCDYSEKIDELVRLFKLTKCEKKILILSYLRQTNDNFCRSTDCLSDSSLSRILGTKIDEVILSKNINRNIRMYILEDRERGYKLQDHILYFFSDYGNPNEFFYKECIEAPFDIKSFVVNKKEIETLLCLLNTNTTGMNVLFYGEAGTGKTELAKSIARVLNKKTYFINNENDRYGVKKRLASINACINSVDLDNSIIVVDEADSVLNTAESYLISGENVEKGFINKLLEQNQAKIIWITNNVHRIEASVLRRFSFSIQFKQMTKQQRTQMWEHVLKQKELSNFLDDHEIAELSDKYHVNTSGIAMALNGVQPIIKTVPKEEVKSKIDIILKNHETLLYGEHKKKISNNSINYSLEGLNTDVDPKHVCNLLSSFKENKGSGIRNMNVLLCGAPGTGKTEFARYLARELEIEMVNKTASELISCYIGETEKNIRYAFQEAQEQGAILFIDEADTFLYPRESAQRSWEISHTNEMLCQIEAFEGVLICATNFYKNLDAASIRRFNIKMNFDYLTNEGKLLFYKKIFGDKINTDDTLIKTKLNKIEHLTPGDFKVVYQKNFYLQNIEHERIIQDLMLESKSKTCVNNKRVGFN